MRLPRIFDLALIRLQGPGLPTGPAFKPGLCASIENQLFCEYLGTGFCLTSPPDPLQRTPMAHLHENTLDSGSEN